MNEKYEGVKINISLEEYNSLMAKAFKYECLRNAVIASVKAYSTGGVYIDNNLLAMFKVICPYDYQRAVQAAEGGKKE